MRDQAYGEEGVASGQRRKAQWRVKEVADPIFAAVILFLLAPLFLAIMAGIKLTSRGPIFFRQTRYGKDKRLFDIWKFRSMYIAACDARLGGEINQATKGDPRITPIGAFLRRTSLDELPQLINIVAGEMSLVGPRPHAVAEDDHFATLIADYDGRFRAKPGITGLAQVRGLRGEITSDAFMRRRVAEDIAYIDTFSLPLDAWIAWRTIIVLFKEQGAY